MLQLKKKTDTVLVIIIDKKIKLVYSYNHR